MPLPDVNLDDRHFQDIVDEAKRLIPRYCPEWTDHNVSDPGVALIELFAWMTDLLLYRVNQVPDKMYVRFLEMIGIRLQPPRSARAPVTFYLSAPQEIDIVIPEGTEVATTRTETTDPIIFTTERELAIRPPKLQGLFTRKGRQEGWYPHDMRKLEVESSQIAMFPAKPQPEDAFYMAFETDHSYHVLALVVDCEAAGGAGVDPLNPPWSWEVWKDPVARWLECEVEYDATGGFNQPGEIILHLPEMGPGELQGVRAFWLRCRLTDAQGGDQAYRVSPDLRKLQLESRGGTAFARHATTVNNEHLGRSEGTPGQTFRLRNQNILERDSEREFLIVEPPGMPAQHWHEVSDFADSTSEDHHFTLDSIDGLLTLGPKLVQPELDPKRDQNGSRMRQYSFGAIPPKNSELTFSRYQYGGGAVGNVARGALNTLKTSIPYIARVSNRRDAIGGQNAESLEDAKVRAPRQLRTRTRAVTADDYEYLSTLVPGVARACSLAPGAQPDPSSPQPGRVAVLLLPRTDNVTERIAPEFMVPSGELITAVRTQLDSRRPLGIALEVRGLQLYWVSVQAVVNVHKAAEQLFRDDVLQRAEAALYRYLNPYIGGPDGTGWPFGRDLHVSEILSLLQQLMGVEYVSEVKLTVTEPGSQAAKAVTTRLDLPAGAVICSERHTVKIA
jgi:predicted phage baseplate assembly protein